jgi:glycoside/pentoside/hexuronide:cation symporter, GPH family
MSRPRPSLRTRLAYGVGAVAFGVKDNGFSFFLLLYYNQVLGLPQASVGLAIMLALILDAFSDPVVGYLSDHTRSRWGRRHPFMYAAALPVAVSYYFLWSPPAGLAGRELLAYLIVMSVLVRTLITVYEIPSSALAAELTDHYDERTTILGFRYFFGWWGGLGMAILAYAVFLQPDATHPVGVLNPDGYRGYAAAASAIMLAAILVSAVGTHGHIPHLRRAPAHRPHGVRATAAELRETLANRSFLMLFGAAMFGSMAAGLMAALNIYFNTYFWELTSDQISVLVLGNFVSATVALGLAALLTRRIGKRRAALLSAGTALVLGPAPVALRLLGAFPANGSPALVPTLFVANVALVTLFITASIVVASMVADVVEDSEVVTGRRSEGVFFAANSFVQKAVSGIGIFSSTLLLTAIGFPRDAKPGEVDPAVVRNLGLVFVPVLVVLYTVMMTFLGAYRIDRGRHEDNLRRLSERAVR